MPSLVTARGRRTTTASLLLMFLLLVSSSLHVGLVSALVGGGGVGAKDVATASELLVPGGAGGGGGDDDASPRTTRARVNEIDFCMAPADVTLSLESSDSTTRVLNLASNRAVRRIILSRSWPSAEALNASLRSVLAGQRQREDEEERRANDDAVETVENSDNLKCPVPQPILDVIMRRRGRRGGDDATAAAGNDDDDDADVVPSTKRGRSGTEWVKDQLSAFRTNFGETVGYREAAAYLECVLALATDGTESPLVEQVMEDGVYDESYQRLKSVLRSVGVVFENVEDDGDGDGDVAIVRTRIAPKMVDQDICLSMLDKISLQREAQFAVAAVGTAETTTSTEQKSKEEEEKEEEEIEASNDDDDDDDVDVAVSTTTEEDEPKEKIDETTTTTTTTTNNNKTGRRRFPFFFMSRKDPPASTTTNVADDVDGKEQEQQEEENEEEEESPLDPSDLGGVLLSAEEPTVTRQLNVLANIVRRTLLFGGDEELAVLSETLAADRPAFVRRWYPDRGGDDPSSSPAAVRFLDALVGLLRDCGAEGRVRDLAPPAVLAGHDGESYRNAYGRLAAGLVELGSGYLAPPVDAAPPPYYDAPPPKTPSEELGRLAAWESAVRAGVPYDAYPDDLVGEWEVRDEVVGGRAIGASRVALAEGGGVIVLSPERDDGTTSGRRRRGLRWRLDPGPTHLDTCTFQALDEDDGTVLQYKGFVDRGARLESRFSKRPITIRGAVTFQMRDGESSASEGYRRDMLPIGYNKLGTTRFVMTKSVGGGKDKGGDAAGN